MFNRYILIVLTTFASACGPADRHVLCLGAEAEGGSYLRCEFEEVGCDSWEQVQGTYDEQEQCFAALDAIVNTGSGTGDDCATFAACAVGRSVAESVDDEALLEACGPVPAGCVCYRCDVDGLVQDTICSCEPR